MRGRGRLATAGELLRVPKRSNTVRNREIKRGIARMIIGARL